MARSSGSHHAGRSPIAGLRSRVVLGYAMLLALILAAACAQEPLPALRFDSSRLQIQNQTERTWAEVEIWLNDHYRVQIPSLAPKQMAVVPLDVFVAGYGQRFNPKKQVVYGIEVSVRDGPSRVPVLVWGKGKKKY